jgi:predicted transglutaminase-like cysteine proteinase
MGLGFCLGLTGGLGTAAAAGPRASSHAKIRVASLGSLHSEFEPAVPRRSSEPFGLATSDVFSGGVVNKWDAVNKALLKEQRILIRCRENYETCRPAARRFLAVVDKAMTRKGRIRIAEINRAINLNIRPVDDMTQYGVQDLWATPLMTFNSGAGDCEDYAIAKYVALLEIGIPTEDIRLVVVRDRAQQGDHAVTAVRYHGHWLILDNRTLSIHEDAEIAYFNPLFVLDSQGVKRIVASRPKPHPRPQKAHEVATRAETIGEQPIFTGPTTPFLL